MVHCGAAAAVTNLEGSRLARDKRVCCAHADIHCSMSGGAAAGGAGGAGSAGGCSSSSYALSFMLYI